MSSRQNERKKKAKKTFHRKTEQTQQAFPDDEMLHACAGERSRKKTCSSVQFSAVVGTTGGGDRGPNVGNAWRNGTDPMLFAQPRPGALFVSRPWGLPPCLPEGTSWPPGPGPATSDGNGRFDRVVGLGPSARCPNPSPGRRCGPLSPAVTLRCLSKAGAESWFFWSGLPSW